MAIAIAAVVAVVLWLSGVHARHTFYWQAQVDAFRALNASLSA